jgi:hypothetical protein
MFNKTNLHDEIFLLKQFHLSVWCDALALAGVVARVDGLSREGDASQIESLLAESFGN